MVDVIEGEAVEVAEPRALVPAPPETQVIVGGAAIARMSDEEFDRNLAALTVARVRAKRIQLALMEEGTDYGKVPGIDRPFLHKPGAETLDKAFGLAVRFDATRVIGDGDTEPPIAFHVKGFAHLGDFDGPVVAQGYGEANAWEERYRYRKAERLCPKCQKPAVIKGKAEYGGGWLCWKKKDGCGSTWPDGASEIEGQNTDKVDNPDPWGLANTLLKMAVKRAHVDTTLRATGTSGLFTQDEDSPVVRPQPAQDGPGTALAGDEPPMPTDAPAQNDEPVYQGQDTFTGRITIGTNSPTDGQVRTDPDGQAFVGFSLTLPTGKRVQATAEGPLALALDAATEGVTSLHGVEATVEGALYTVPWKKDGKRMPPYKRVVIERIGTPDFVLPAATE